MTPEARREAATGAYHQIADGPGPHTVERLIDALDEFYAAEIRAAVEAEREACARVICGGCEFAGMPTRDVGPRLMHQMTSGEWVPCRAAAIRERGKA